MQHFYDRLINKVMSSASLQRLKRTGVDEEAEPAYRFTQPFVTVSREPGSGGKPVARLVAKRLKFKFYNREIIEDVAKSVRQRKALLEGIDERGRTAIDDIIHGAFNPDYVSDTRYIRHLCQVVLSAAINGEVVILGRGANFITPFDKGLHIRVQAPYFIRVERAVKYEKILREEAIQIIKEVDERRKAFIKQYFAKDISSPNYYDVVINTTNMTIEDAASLIIEAFKNKFPDYARRYLKRFETS